MSAIRSTSSASSSDGVTAVDSRTIFDLHARLVARPGALDALLSTMDRCRIDRAAVSAGGMIDISEMSRMVIQGGGVDADADNDAVLAGCSRSGGRLVPFFFANPHRDPAVYRDRAGEFRGVEISPAVHGVDLTDERTLALVAVAAEFGHPVYTVCLGRRGSGVVDLVTLAERFPDVTFVLGHCGFVGIDLYAINVIAPWTNILAETSGCYTFVARAALERLGDDRVLFGTEYPLQHPTVELTKFDVLNLHSESLQKVMWRNAYRILGEEIGNEPDRHTDRVGTAAAGTVEQRGGTP
jgi:predicted TIM-barrel fold metal-dependent hydrolase